MSNSDMQQTAVPLKTLFSIKTWMKAFLIYSILLPLCITAPVIFSLLIGSLVGITLKTVLYLPLTLHQILFIIASLIVFGFPAVLWIIFCIYKISRTTHIRMKFPFLLAGLAVFGIIGFIAFGLLNIWMDEMITQIWELIGPRYEFY